MRRPPDDSGPGATEDLLRQTRLLKSQLSVFGKSAREVHRRLNLTVPDDEVEAMRSPAANLLGTLECLIADDLKPVFTKLGELDTMLQKEVVADKRDCAPPDEPTCAGRVSTSGSSRSTSGRAG